MPRVVIGTDAVGRLQCFRGIRKLLFATADPATGHTRWAMRDELRWDCRRVWDAPRWNKDVVRGVLQLVEAVGLTSRLPASLDSTLGALFAYRNKMFHWGFEWPQRERAAFAKRLSDESWSASWFLRATTNNEPWVFYLSPEFVEHCVRVIGEILDGIGAFVRDSSRG